MTAQIITGTSASEGIGIGQIVIYRKPKRSAKQSTLDPDEVKAEQRRFQEAVERTREQIARARAATLERAGPDEAAIFDAHALFLDDPSFIGEIERQIEEQRLPAGAAIESVSTTIEATFAELEDPYLRARAADVRDVADQLLLSLERDQTQVELADNSIIVADELLASDTALLDISKIVGLASSSGSLTSHAVILARALGIPMLTGLERLPDEELAGQSAIIDANDGTLIINPEPNQLASAQEQLDARRLQQQQIDELRDVMATTRDGQRIRLTANIGSVAEAELARDHGAEGIGLFRTEFLFLDRPELPSEDEQYEAYRRVAEIMDGKPVIIRTLDAGGDKPLAGVTLEDERNPFLGVRGIRLTLAYPDLFRTQLRALLRAAGAGDIWIMLPMVATVDDVRAARQIVDEVARELQDAGLDHRGDIPIGIMIEVPSAAIAIDRLLPEVDFVSIGTNDLVQYTLAVDRTNAALAGQYAELDVAVLRLIQTVMTAAAEAGKHAAICGELAGDLTAIPTLIGLGTRDLSMVPARVVHAKQLINDLKFTEVRAQAESRIT